MWNITPLRIVQQTISVQELRKQLSLGTSLQIIDVRSHDEFASGHIPTAVNIPLEEVESRIRDVRPMTPVVLACNSGSRAEMCAEKLAASKDEILVLEGGTEAWINEGVEVIRTTSSTWAIERQVRFAAGIIVLIGTVLAAAGATSWLFLAMFVGAGLTFSGLTNFCGMAKVIAALPWNRPKPNSNAILEA
jgi:rhodanese-related sulfurtransferase